VKIHKRRVSGNASSHPAARSCPRKFQLVFEAHGVRRRVAGQTARALRVLIEAGSQGATALEVSSWALRFAAYCFKLRHVHGLDIETVREAHDGGWHGRHVLRTPVQIVGIVGEG